MAEPSAQAHARELIAYIDASPTPYHAVARAARRLEDAGFVPLSEQERWELPAGTRAYVVRGGSSLAAFIVGTAKAADAGFLLIGAHTDSPNLRVRPLPDVRSLGYRQLAVEPYGGLLQSTWMDRDLSIAGRVVIDDGTPAGRTRLIDFRRAMLRIPNVAIHLNRTVNSDGLKLNPQTQMIPVMGLTDAGPDLDFVELLAEHMRNEGVRCEANQVVSFDLCLYDMQPATLAGAHDELVLAARLDNLASCHAALGALCAARDPKPETRGIVLYDHEEVGSKSAVGAGSPFLQDVLYRIASEGEADPHEALTRAVSRSLLISADMAHAVHPNYADKHEPAHRPVLGQGPVLKVNVAQSYASDAETSARFALLCRRAGVPLQHFVSRSDQSCGSTIGPITAGRIGIPTVDVGGPLLSMHSIREMAAAADVEHTQKALNAFFA